MSKNCHSVEGVTGVNGYWKHRELQLLVTCPQHRSGPSRCLLPVFTIARNAEVQLGDSTDKNGIFLLYKFLDALHPVTVSEGKNPNLAFVPVHHKLGKQL